MTEEGNLSKDGIKYRIRFLQKSHLPAKRPDDVHYGCVFCIHQGHTLDMSDATVFFTTKALFSHLARHPRPLPKVPGVTVVEEAEMPEHLRNDYDIHFPNPPVAHPAHENRDDIIHRPTGIAKRDARRCYGQKQLYDRSLALELDKGARITGIKWPANHKGEWIFAWHDGVYASVPMELIQLDFPPATEMKMGGTSYVCAKARWKFGHKDKETGQWLKFDKHDPITNIGCECRPPSARQRVGGLADEVMFSRAVSRALVLVREQPQGQMGHLPPGVSRHEYGAGAPAGPPRPGEQHVQRKAQNVVGALEAVSAQVGQAVEPGRVDEQSGDFATGISTAPEGQQNHRRRAWGGERSV